MEKTTPLTTTTPDNVGTGHLWEINHSLETWLITHVDCTAQTFQICYKIISYRTLSTKYIAPIHMCISNKLDTNIGPRPGTRQFPPPTPQKKTFGATSKF